MTARARGPYVPAVPARHEITLKGMRFHVLAGILPHEAEFPQPLEIDVTVWLDERAPGAAAALDYRALYEAVASCVNAARVRYLEDLVRQTAHAVLALEHVGRVRIAARKPHVALPGPLAYAEVAIEQDRDA